MQFYTVIFFLSMSFCILLTYKMERKAHIKEQREESINRIDIKKMTNNLALSIEEQASFSKKKKAELMCARAGLKIGYGQYFIMCCLCAILLPIVLYVLLKNEYLMAVSFLLGFTVPSQVITIFANRRTAALDKQVGSFLQIVTERYSNTKDFSKALSDCVNDFKGSEPLYSELLDTTMEVKLGVSVNEALKNLALRTGNKYINRLADYYSLSIQIGTDDSRSTLLKQAYLQYEENRTVTNNLKASVAGPANEVYLMIGFIPLTMIYNSCTNPEYLTFITTTTMGKVGVALIFAVTLGALWLVNTKISAPLD